MSDNLKPEERELVKLVNYFRKHNEKLSLENNLSEEYRHMLETCEKLLEQVNLHAKNRDVVHAEREQLKSLVRDNAVCPKCSSSAMLKVTGVDVNERGWKSNKYKCRSCNIEFVWTTPNNPWDMIPYVENFLEELEKKSLDLNMDDSIREQTTMALVQMRTSLGTLRPIVEASDLDFAEMEAREKEMSVLVNKVKKHLLIEKIRIEE
jgi:hypothetical protein